MFVIRFERKECSRCKSVIGTVRDPVRKALISLTSFFSRICIIESCTDEFYFSDIWCDWKLRWCLGTVIWCHSQVRLVFGTVMWCDWKVRRLFGTVMWCDSQLRRFLVTDIWCDRKVRRCFGTVIWCDSKVHHFFGTVIWCVSQVRRLFGTVMWCDWKVRRFFGTVMWCDWKVRRFFCYGHLVRLQAATLRLLRSFAATQGCDSWLGTVMWCEWKVRRSFGTVMWCDWKVRRFFCYGHLVRLQAATLRLLRSFAATQGCDSWLATVMWCEWKVRRSFGTVMWCDWKMRSCYGHLVRLTGATCVFGTVMWCDWKVRRFLVADIWSTDRCDGVLLRSVRTAPYLDWFFGFIKALLFSLAKYEASIGILALKQRVHSQKILKSQMMARRAEVEIMLFYRCSLLLFSWYLSF